MTAQNTYTMNVSNADLGQNRLQRPVQRRWLTWRPVSFRYLAWIIADVIKTTLLILLGVEAIFLSDLVLGYILPHVLNYRASFIEFIQVTSYAVPRALFIALPLAMLISVYLIILRRKEDQELTVISGMGYSTRVLIFLVLVVGSLGAGGSLLLSGFVEPHAKFLMKSKISSIAHRALRDGEVGSGKIYSVGDMTFFASLGRLSTTAGDVFIHQQLPEELNRVIIADKTFRQGSSHSGRFGLILEDVAVYEFTVPHSQVERQNSPLSGSRDCADCAEESPIGPLKQLYFDRFFAELPMVEFPELKPRGGRADELTLLELLHEDFSNRKVARTLGERVIRALLCILTPFLALLAVVLTTRGTIWFALPGAAVIVLCISFFGSHIVKLLAPLGFASIAGSTILATVVMIYIAKQLIYRFESNFARSIGVSI